MSGTEPKPQSPARLWIKHLENVKYKGDAVQLTVTVMYDPWCCNGLHEQADAIYAINKLFEDAVENPKWRPEPQDYSSLFPTQEEEEDS